MLNCLVPCVQRPVPVIAVYRGVRGRMERQTRRRRNGSRWDLRTSLPSPDRYGRVTEQVERVIIRYWRVTEQVWMVTEQVRMVTEL